jgi:hypothetical protein
MKTFSLCAVWKKTTIPKVVEIAIYKSNNLGTTSFCHVLCLGMHCNVMLRLMVQALQDPPFM